MCMCVRGGGVGGKVNFKHGNLLRECLELSATCDLASLSENWCA